MPTATPTRIQNVDMLRGFAALAVCAFHFGGNGCLSSVKGLGFLLDRGWVGVPIFFVISGFIIPTALFRSAYTLDQCGGFLARRFVRLYPTFFCVLVLQLVILGALHALPDLTQILTNVTFTAGFAGRNWIVAPFWTLALEEQFYLIIALLFPVILRGSEMTRFLVIAGFLFAGLIGTPYYAVTSALPLFSFGVLAFMAREGMMSHPRFLALSLFAGYLQWCMSGPVSAAGALATSLFIVYGPELRRNPLHRVGAISYSLYLVHFVVGAKAVEWAIRTTGSLWIRASVAVGVTSASLVAAWALYALVERPTNEVSKRMKERRVPRMVGETRVVVPVASH